MSLFSTNRSEVNSLQFVVVVNDFTTVVRNSWIFGLWAFQYKKHYIYLWNNAKIQFCKDFWIRDLRIWPKGWNQKNEVSSWGKVALILKMLMFYYWDFMTKYITSLMRKKKGKKQTWSEKFRTVHLPQNKEWTVSSLNREPLHNGGKSVEGVSKSW